MSLKEALRSAEDGPLIDLPFASCGIEPEVVAEAEPIEIAAELIVPVAQLGHLLAMKILARDDKQRPQDLIDIRNILNVASRREIERARNALRLIVERGYQRDKDLLRELSDLEPMAGIPSPLRLIFERMGRDSTPRIQEPHTPPVRALR